MNYIKHSGVTAGKWGPALVKAVMRDVVRGSSLFPLVLPTITEPLRVLAVVVR